MASRNSDTNVRAEFVDSPRIPAFSTLNIPKPTGMPSTFATLNIPMQTKTFPSLSTLIITSISYSQPTTISFGILLIENSDPSESLDSTDSTSTNDDANITEEINEITTEESNIDAQRNSL